MHRRTTECRVSSVRSWRCCTGQVAVAVLVMCWLAPEAGALQSGRGVAAGKPAIRACSLLTKELLMQVSPLDKQALELSTRIPPMEDSVGASGSACSYGDVTLQIDPFPPGTFEKLRLKDLVSVPQLGDAAYFRDNGGRYAELYTHVGGRVLTIQMSVPTGRTAASIQPNVIALAKAILPRL